MSDQKKPKLEKITTPAGIAKYPRISGKPETEIAGKPCKPTWKITLVLDEADKGVPEFKANLEKRHADSVAAARKAAPKPAPGKKAKELVVNELILPHVDDEGNVVDGKFEIRAKTNAEYEDKKTKQLIQRKVPVFDAKGNKINPKLGGGSKVKLSVAPSAYDGQMGCGVTLYLEAVQVLELVEYSGGGSAKSHGFGQEEGYVAEEESTSDAGSEFPDDAATGGEDAPARTKGDF